MGKDNVIALNYDKFDEKVNSLSESGVNFVLKQSGSIRSVDWRGCTFMGLDKDDVKGVGFHLVHHVKETISDRLKDGMTVEYRGEDYKTQLFNIGGIEKVIGKTVVAIDINNCYWRKLLKLGYIDEKLYIAGLKNKDWKTGRNASVGSLVKTTTYTPYINGKAQYKLRTTDKIDERLYWIRNKIIGEIYDMFIELQKRIGDDFLMFLTDCVYTDYSKLEEVAEFFKLNGYEIKYSPVCFLKIDKETDTIYWWDYARTGFKRNGKKKEKLKYYSYRSRQLTN